MNPPLKACIVVIEDNPADAHLLHMALEEHGVNGAREVLKDGEAALAWSDRVARGAAAPPDLIILDLNLPTHDGIEVLAHFRKVPRLQDVPVAVFTSSESAAEKDRAKTLAISAFVSKPPDLDSFLARGAVFRGILETVNAK
jgi:CheY-like chemotaxis protein